MLNATYDNDGDLEYLEAGIEYQCCPHATYTVILECDYSGVFLEYLSTHKEEFKASIIKSWLEKKSVAFQAIIRIFTSH